MKIIKIITFALIILNSTLVSANKSTQVQGLKTDHLENPIGVDNHNPRFTWIFNNTQNGFKQSAYRIIIDTDSVNVSKNLGDTWDSGQTTSDAQLVSYSGKDLLPHTKYYWKVLTFDNEFNITESPIQYFETGQMGNNNWQGNWISDGRDIDYKPASYFRKKFNSNKNIKSARAYLAVAGLYELHINGEKIGDQRLDPMYTRFDRRNLYITHDVTSQLKSGDNVIGVHLGNGWYNHQSLAVWNFENAPWRNRPTFCIDLRITYTDGTVETIYSDLSWKRHDSPITFNSIYTGEHYDARLEQEGWSEVNFDDSNWHGVSLRSAPSDQITSQQIRPIRNVMELSAVNTTKFDDQTYVFDFGQNMSGVTKIKLNGEEGTEIRIKHGERLREDGRIDMSNIDVYYRGDNDTDPFQTDILILSGKKEDEFMARFNYKGFRYVEVTSSKPIDISKDNITAYFMHSDVPAIGKVEGSNDIINKLWKVTNNAYLSNLMGYPTDCPQREKNGWTGDGHFAIETALYNFDAITVYEKWINDHKDEQQPNGVLPDIIPTGGWGYGTHNGLDWTSTIAIIPWEIYRFYGDSKLLFDAYDNIKRYVDYVDRISIGHLTSWGRGDWVPVKSVSNVELTSSVYFYVDTNILAEAAKLFGKEDDYKYYTELAIKIKNAINDKFLDRSKGIYASGTQTELSVPLQWKVVPEDMINKVAKNLADKVEENNFHLDVGVLGAKAILNALSENGYAEAAYKIAVQDTYPSWGWWVVNGATTLLENWDLDAERDISDNHMMFGEIGAWFYKGLGGIFPDKNNPGFKHTILRPNFIKDLNHFNASFNSPHGLIESKWIWNKKDIQYTVTIPANCSATLYLPKYIKGDSVISLNAGKHEFNFKTTTR